MPYSFLQFALVVVGLALICVVLIRHLPQIALLDMHKLPEEQQARTKKAIIEKQYLQALTRYKKILGRVCSPLGAVWRYLQRHFRDAVTHTYLRYAKTRARMVRETQEGSPPPEAIGVLLKDAETALITEHYDEAEQKYIEVIRMAPRNTEAYRGLARVYFEKKQWKEAEEMYLFILRMDQNDGRALNRLGMIAMERERWNDALRYFKRAVDIDSHMAVRQFDLGTVYAKLGKHVNALRVYERAVSLEPLNPKYLDAYLEEAIKAGNKSLAGAIFDQLKFANPDNKKLGEFRRRVEEMETLPHKKILHNDADT